MANHVWRILNHKESLWVKWIHAYHLHDKSFWDVQIRPDASWSWRKILLTRNVIHKHFFHQINIGHNTLAWFDVWNEIGPLTNLISWHDINGAGFNAYSSVHDVIDNGQWLWPMACVWDKAKTFISSTVHHNNWLQILQQLASGSINNASFMVSKLMFAASIYLNWQERNSRLFKGKRRSSERLFEDIYSTPNETGEVRVHMRSIELEELGSKGY
ncbi:uncharacterized protein [Rutidosis leptorrhynchoides]|uniref:uncharacterized protein n=1 Tax=Rutidosis leptorrhynchoides TaxID=125765 RepID=UPI003A99C52F